MSRVCYCYANFKTDRPLNPCHRDKRYGMTQSVILPCLHLPAETNIIMSNIIELVKSGVTGLSLNIQIEDLVEFADHIINQATEKLLPPMVKESEERLLTKAEVLEKFNVCPTTLWNWEKKRYIEPVKIGRKVYYRRAHVENIILERARQ